jgi:hypothetical protein
MGKHVVDLLRRAGKNRIRPKEITCRQDGQGVILGKRAGMQVSGRSVSGHTAARNRNAHCPEGEHPMKPLVGSCRCGKTEIEVSAPPIMTAACHCDGCRKMSASAFSLTAMVPTSAFHVTKGEPVKGGAKGPQLDHYFCPDCMTWMFTRIVGMDAFVNVRPTMFDDARLSYPFMETMTAEKLAWVELPVEHSYTGFPPPEDFAKLMQDFAARWAAAPAEETCS